MQTASQPGNPCSVHQSRPDMATLEFFERRPDPVHSLVSQGLLGPDGLWWTIANITPSETGMHHDAKDPSLPLSVFKWLTVVEPWTASTLVRNKWRRGLPEKRRRDCTMPVDVPHLVVKAGFAVACEWLEDALRQNQPQLPGGLWQHWMPPCETQVATESLQVVCPKT